MSESKKRISIWVPTVILGVVAVLFSFYALQLQTELNEARDRIKAAEEETVACKKAAMELQQKAQMQAEVAIKEAERALQLQMECEKSKNKK